MSNNIEEKELALQNQNLTELPAHLIDTHKDIVTKINLSNNQLNSANYIDLFTKLDTLVLDKNNLKNLNFFPLLTSLKTLWLNNNKIMI